MNKILFYGLCFVLMALTSCQEEISEQRFQEDGFSIEVRVNELETGVKTRAFVTPETGEDKVNSLYVLLFRYTKEGSGTYIGYHKVTSSQLSMSSTVTLPTTLDNGATITDTQSYSILAFANLEESGGHAGDGYIRNITEFLDGFENKTEIEVLNATRIAVEGSGIDEDDDTHTLRRENLLMSARTGRMVGQVNTAINLTRGVARIDIFNQASTHLLKSVSVWGAVKSTSLWEGFPAGFERMQRFYGIKNITEQEVKGKIYAFENKVASPVLGDKETTCLIVGLAPASNPDQVSYYRINVSQPNTAQNLKRNFSYRIEINSVSTVGADTEYEAWTQQKNLLGVSVNNWNLDDNNMLLTDGTNTLGIPVKRVRFDPQGDSREYSIYTEGTGVVEISRRDFPMEADGFTPAFTAVIENNTLKLTASKLPADQTGRRGSLEISYAGLRGSIDLIQEPMDNDYLYLDRNTANHFGPAGRNGMIDGPITVTSSGPWVAEIFNMDASADNPGFSFNPSGAPVTKIYSMSNPAGNEFQIYTTGDNPYPNDERNGFVIVSLVGDPENYSIAVPLIQDVKPVFQILPAVSEVRFYADATPVNTAIANGNLYEFTVNSGGADWSVALSGGNSNRFEVVKTTAQQFTVKAVGQNIVGSPWSSTIKVVSGTDEISIPVIQETAIIKATFSGQIPTRGGTITVTVGSSNLTWDAEIIENWNSGSSTNKHEAYLEAASGGGKVTSLINQPADGSFKVGFDALNFPLINRTPKVKIKVSIHGMQGVSQTIEVTQIPLAPTSLRVMDVMHNSYGSLGGSDNRFNGYNAFLRSPSLFGPNGRVKLPTITITDVASNSKPGVISSDYGYVHAGGRPDRYTEDRFISVENWRQQNDGVVVYVCNVKGSPFTSPNSTLKKLNYVYANNACGGLGRINNGLINSSHTLSKNIMKYLLEDGPFGRVNKPSSLSFTTCGTSTSVQSYPANAVPVIIEKHGYAMLVIDPENRLIYLGESKFFHACYSTNIKNDKDRFLGNLLAYTLNAGLYGSAFTEDFADDARYKAKYGK